MSEKNPGLSVDARLDHLHNLYLTDSAGNPHRHFAIMSIEYEIETGGSDREVLNLNPLKERWKHGTVETDEATSSIDLQSQTGLQQLEASAGSPGLWGTGRRI